MADWSRLWDIRNEPFSVITSIGLLMIVLVVSVLSCVQFFYREAPLFCEGQILPHSLEDCRKESSPLPPESDFPPVGTVMAFFGDDEDIPSGWTLCDGRENPPNSKINFDADGEKGGDQLPDLRGRFIRGAKEPLDGKRIQVGGSDKINLKHSHHWVTYNGGHWHSFTSDGRSIQIDNWNNGIHNEGEGDYPLLASGNMEIYTNEWGNDQMDNLPKYAELRFIIRIF